MTEEIWRVRGREFANCNCSYGCPCQFNALPTHGDCYAAAGYRIDEGHHRDTPLDGLRAAAIYKWPGAVHEGDGKMQIIIDENADEAQRDALTKIMTGEDTEPMTTMWSVFHTMCTTVYPPLFEKIDFQVDVEGRTARLVVPGLIDGAGEPIKNPVTGLPHRARIDLPHGFEYSMAEIGSGTTRTNGEVEISVESTYAQFADIHLNNTGVVR
ncbi:MAG: DUF1326 domain-containing protein [Pseudomonadota bacterium]